MVCVSGHPVAEALAPATYARRSSPEPARHASNGDESLPRWAMKLPKLLPGYPITNPAIGPGRGALKPPGLADLAFDSSLFW